MAAGSALIALETAAMDHTVLMASAARTAESIRPAGFLQGSLTLFLGAVEPLELSQGEASLELDRATRHVLTGICVPFYGSALAVAE